MAKKNPWSRPIDYDKAIADDHKEIARYTRRLETAKRFAETDTPFLRLDLVGGGSQQGLDLARFLWAPETRAERWAWLTGDTHEGLCCLFATLDLEPPGLVIECSKLPDGWWRRGEELADRALATMGLSDGFDAVYSVERETACLRHWRASLARHLRNKAKHT